MSNKCRKQIDQLPIRIRHAVCACTTTYFRLCVARPILMRNNPTLLAAMDHRSGVVIGQAEVGAMHTQRTAADYITGRSAHFVMTVKNQCPAATRQ